MHLWTFTIHFTYIIYSIYHILLFNGKKGVNIKNDLIIFIIINN